MKSQPLWATRSIKSGRRTIAADGELKRGPGLVLQARAQLSAMMTAAGVPQIDGVMASVMLDEAAANAANHGRAGTVLIRLRVDPGCGRITMLLVYCSEWFDHTLYDPETADAWNDSLIASGRGIITIKGAAAETAPPGSATWRFSDPVVAVRMVRRFPVR